MAPLLTPRDAALRLGISYAAIKQWIYRGKLKAIKTPGGTSIITADAAREMRLKKGETVAALIKSTEVMVLRV